jgi:hypothetical protein
MRRSCNLLSPFFFLALVFAFFAVAPTGCGGSSRQLQSLSVNPTSVTAQNAQAQFIANGQFTQAPMIGPARAAWFEEPPIFDPPSTVIGLSLTDQPFTAQCIIQSPTPVTVTVTAVSPVDANAPANTSIPLNVFVDLVKTHSVTQEGGFVAAKAQLNCP